jgi:xanthine/uracil permease
LDDRHGWFGDYDYAWLCMPTLPFSTGTKRKVSNGPPFYALDTELPLFLAMTTGLQHALAMLAGLITPPIIFASALNLDGDISAYMVSASLIGCGEWSLLDEL